jgi:hypothetical protein
MMVGQSHCFAVEEATTPAVVTVPLTRKKKFILFANNIFIW